MDRPSSRARILFDQMMAGEAASAVVEARAVDGVDPLDQLDLILVEAELALLAGNTVVAADHLARAEQLGRRAGVDDQMVRLTSARLATVAAETQKALELIGELLIDPGFEQPLVPRAELLLAENLTRLGERDQAVDHYRRVIDADADLTDRERLEVTARLGCLAAEAGDGQEVERSRAKLDRLGSRLPAAHAFGSLVDATSLRLRHRQSEAADHGTDALAWFLDNGEMVWAMRAAVEVALTTADTDALVGTGFPVSALARAVGFDPILGLAELLLASGPGWTRPTELIRSLLIEAVAMTREEVSPLVLFEACARARSVEQVREARLAEQSAQAAFDTEVEYQRTLVNLTTNEFRGLLGSLSLSVDRLALGPDPAEEERFDAVLDRMSALTVQLDVSSPDAYLDGDFEPIDLNPIVRAQAAATRVLAAPWNVSIALDLPDDAAAVALDRSLAEALANWVLWAGADASAHDGQVTVHLGVADPDGTIGLEVATTPIRSDLAERPALAWWRAAETVLQWANGSIRRSVVDGAMTVVVLFPTCDSERR